jgi:hypothetical protein
MLIYQRLKQKKIPGDLLARVATEGSSAQHAQESNKVRKRLIQQGVFIFIQETLYIPPMMYMVV